MNPPVWRCMQVSIASYQRESRLKLQLVGCEVVMAKQGGFLGSLVIDFSRLYPPDETGYREPAKGLVVECPWRLFEGQKLLVGCDDERRHIDECGASLIGQTLLSARISSPGFTLRAAFDDGRVLWVYPCDSAFLSDDEPRSRWYVVGRDLMEVGVSRR